MGKGNQQIKMFPLFFLIYMFSWSTSLDIMSVHAKISNCFIRHQYIHLDNIDYLDLNLNMTDTYNGYIDNEECCNILLTYTLNDNKRANAMCVLYDDCFRKWYNKAITSLKIYSITNYNLVLSDCQNLILDAPPVYYIKNFSETEVQDICPSFESNGKLCSNPKKNEMDLSIRIYFIGTAIIFTLINMSLFFFNALTSKDV